MNNEWLIILAFCLSGSLFAIGGTGFKWARRFLLPVLLGVIAAISGVLWWKAAGYAVSLSIALCLPYGSRTPYWLKFLVFCCFGLPCLWFGWTIWVILCPIICISIFAASNWKQTANDFVWKCCEFAFGVIIAWTFVASIPR